MMERPSEKMRVEQEAGRNPSLLLVKHVLAEIAALETERDKLKDGYDAAMEQIGKLIAERDQARADAEKLAEALNLVVDVAIWMSGSKDFAPSGKAGKAWPEQRERLNNAIAVAAAYREATQQSGRKAGGEGMNKRRITIHVTEMELGGWESDVLLDGEEQGSGTGPTASSALDVAMDILYGDKNDCLNNDFGVLSRLEVSE